MTTKRRRAEKKTECGESSIDRLAKVPVCPMARNVSPKSLRLLDKQ